MRGLATFGLLALLAPEAAAEEPKAGQLAGYRLFVENDALARGGDRAYTGGIKLEWWLTGPSARNDGPSVVDRAVRSWCAHRAAKDDLACGSEVAVGVAQQAYTPKDLAFAGPQPWDRPWAGYLFVSSSIVLETASRYHALEGHVGIIGPESGARYVQIQTHELINDVRPAGWDQQIPNQLALEAIYTYRRRWTRRNVDFIAGGEGSVGTVRVHAAAGGTVRFGRDLSGFGKPRIATSVPSPGARDGWFVFATVEGRLVVFDTFLEGGTFRRVDTAIRPKTTRADAAVGFAVPLTRSRRCNLAYELIVAGPEFDGDARHRYGSVAISCAALRTGRAQPRRRRHAALGLVAVRAHTAGATAANEVPEGLVGRRILGIRRGGTGHAGREADFVRASRPDRELRDEPAEDRREGAVHRG